MGIAFDQLHDEVGPALFGGAGVKHLGDVGMIHEGDGLAFGLEAGEHFLAVHARLDDFEGDHAADRL